MPPSCSALFRIHPAGRIVVVEATAMLDSLNCASMIDNLHSMMQDDPTIAAVLDISSASLLQSTSLLRLRELALHFNSRISFCGVEAGSESILAPAGPDDPIRIWPDAESAVASWHVLPQPHLAVAEQPRQQIDASRTALPVDPAALLTAADQEAAVERVDSPEEARNSPGAIKKRRKTPSTACAIEKFPAKQQETPAAITPRKARTSRMTRLHTGAAIAGAVLAVGYLVFQATGGDTTLAICEHLYAEFENLQDRDAPRSEWRNLDAQVERKLVPAVHRLASKGASRTAFETQLLSVVRSLFEVLESRNTDDEPQRRREFESRLQIAKQTT